MSNRFKLFKLKKTFQKIFFEKAFFKNHSNKTCFLKRNIKPFKKKAY